MMDNNKVKKNSKNFIGGLNGIKLTYFVLFFGYGATLPYLALYFRQIGLNASYVGAIAGIRPMVQFVSCPLWAVISDKFRMRRIILNMSIISWLLFTVVLYIPRPKHSYCMDSPIFKDLISDNNNNKTNIQRNDTTTNKYIWPKILGKLNNTNLSNKIPLKNNETMPFEFEISSKRSVLGSINSFQFRNPEHNHVSGRHYIETNNNITQTNPINITTTDDIQQKDDFIIPEIDLFQKNNYIKQFNSTKNNNITTTNGCPIKAIKSKIIKKPLLVVFADENECIPLVFYDKNEVFIVFIIIITLTAVGEFFEAPAVSLLDVAILECLDQQMEKYGKTRLFGSLGFGISSFFVGITLDYYHSTICHQLVTNFMITLYFFVGSMCLAIIISLICIRFENDKDYTTKSIYNNNNNNNEDLYYKQSPCPICNNLNFKPIESSSDDTFKPCKDKYIHEYEFNKKKLPQNTSSFKEIILLLQQTEYFFFIMVSLFLGFSHGSIMNFINWFLEDLGASRLMMGSATVIRDFAVVFGFYISPQILTIFTQLQVIICTFCVYIFSYFCYSIITHPWYAVPVECIQGLAYAIMWSSCITYFGGAVSKENCATMQGVIQGVYWGLGTGSGAIIGGISVFKYGCSKSFQLGGYVTCFAMLFFGLIYYIFVRKNDHQ